MKKVAIFVEGQTEQVFATELVRHIFGHAKVDIETLQLSGKIGIRRIKVIQSVDIPLSISYYFRIYDCQGGGDDSTVKSDINEQADRLKEESFSYIIGIRDVYPLPDVVKLQALMNKGIKTSMIPIKIFLAVREIEAWFIAEENHYSLIDTTLNLPHITTIVGFDITTNSTEVICHPAVVLKRIYNSVGQDYQKHKWEAERIAYELDYDNLYFNVRNRNDSLNKLLSCLDGLIP
jgi:hypothetical protein